MKKTRYILLLIAVFALCVLIALITNVYVATQSLIPNASLEKIIREQINKPEGELTAEDCKGVTMLYLSMSDSNTNLDGLQYFTDLEKLVSNAGNLTDISALSELTELRELSLMKNRIHDLSPLSNLTKLEHLDLYDNWITDVSPLAGLSNLKTLQIGKNPVTDMSPLDSIHNLYIDINY